MTVFTLLRMASKSLKAAFFSSWVLYFVYGDLMMVRGDGNLRYPNLQDVSYFLQVFVWWWRCTSYAILATSAPTVSGFRLQVVKASAKFFTASFSTSRRGSSFLNFLKADLMCLKGVSRSASGHSCSSSFSLSSSSSLSLGPLFLSILGGFSRLPSAVFTSFSILLSFSHSVPCMCPAPRSWNSVFSVW